MGEYSNIGRDVGTGLVCVERECGEQQSLKSCDGFVWAERERGSVLEAPKKSGEEEEERREKRKKKRERKKRKKKCWCGLIKLFFIILKWHN